MIAAARAAIEPVLAALGADPATAETPVVIVSMLDEHGAGFALGAADYLVKPISQRELLRALLRWMFRFLKPVKWLAVACCLLLATNVALVRANAELAARVAVAVAG